MSDPGMDAAEILEALRRPNAVPFNIDRYRAVAIISHSHGCDVYKAIDPKFEGESGESFVAIKLLAPKLKAGAEAAAARRVSHVNVASVLDWGVFADPDLGRREYVVYELVDWPTLDLCREEYQSQRAAASLVERIARGVAACHDVGLVHGDLKPNNVAVKPDGKPVILDFGSAVRPGRPAECSPSFGAPEQREAAGFTSDVYALGGILAWLTSGEFPDRQMQHPGDLGWIVRRALSQHPGARQRSADGLADELRTWLNRKPLPCTPAWRRVVLLGRRRPLASLGTVAATIAVVGASLVTAWNIGRARMVADREIVVGDAAQQLAGVADALASGDSPGTSPADWGVDELNEIYTEVALGGADSERLVVVRSLGAVARAFEAVRDHWDRDRMLAVEAELAELDVKMDQEMGELDNNSSMVFQLLLSARAMMWHSANLGDEAMKIQMIQRSNDVRKRRIAASAESSEGPSDVKQETGNQGRD